MIKPISNYDAYFHKVEEKKLYGIDIQGVKLIEIIDQDGDTVTLNDFFTSGGSMYFTVTEVDSIEVDGETVNETITNFYKQSGDTITKISSLPEKPTHNRITYEHAEFSIKKASYENKDMSDVKNLSVESGIERFYMVNNFFHFAGMGMFIHVADGRYNDVVTVRNKGLYFWPCQSNAIQCVIPGSGEMWK